MEGENKAWLIIKTSNKEDAMRIIPAAYRQSAKITKLHKFTGKEINKTMLDHPLLSSPETPLHDPRDDFEASSLK
jgi:hypothetical protein